MHIHTCPHCVFGEGGPDLLGSVKSEALGQFLAATLGEARPERAALGDTWVRSSASAAEVGHIHPPTR